jgi:hypothetical protein
VALRQTSGGVCLSDSNRSSYVSDLTRSNLAEHTAGTGSLQQYQQHPQLGSQSTLASDRGAGSTSAARLLHTSLDPTHYSTQPVASRTGGDVTAAGSSASGGAASPIWKRRYGGGGGGRSGGGMASSSSHHSPASNDDARDSDGSGDGGSNAPPPREFQKQQRVTFRIPPSAYIETEDTDC